MTHLYFGGTEAGAAVHSVESDGVELTLVQVDHGQLIGFVRRSQGSSERELELTPEPPWWGAGVGARVDRAGPILREGIAVGKRLKKYTGTFINKGKERYPETNRRLAAQESGLIF